MSDGQDLRITQNTAANKDNSGCVSAAIVVVIAVVVAVAVVVDDDDDDVTPDATAIDTLDTPDPAAVMDEEREETTSIFSFIVTRKESTSLSLHKLEARGLNRGIGYPMT